MVLKHYEFRMIMKNLSVCLCVSACARVRACLRACVRGAADGGWGAVPGGPAGARRSCPGLRRYVLSGQTPAAAGGDTFTLA